VRRRIKAANVRADGLLAARRINIHPRTTAGTATRTVHTGDPMLSGGVTCRDTTANASSIQKTVMTDVYTPSRATHTQREFIALLRLKPTRT